MENAIEMSDLVLTPLYVTADGVAVYPVAVITLKKDLAADGVCVEYQYPPEQRQYKRSYSSTAQVAVDFAVSLSSGGLIWAVQALARRGGDQEVRIRTTRTVRRRGVKTSETLEYRGPASGAPAVIETWKVTPPDE